MSLLGPVEARSVAGWGPVAGAKLQALLALLALSTPRPVTDERLIEEVWGDRQPGHPANALQAQISQLRRVLGPAVVVRKGSGYALAMQPDDVDVHRFERLVADGREAASALEHGASAGAFRAAVTLVRGPPLADLVDLEFARTAASRYEQLVISAHEGLVDAELASGRHAEVVDHLNDLVVAHPLRERFHAQLMIALFRCGRQSEALRAYQRVRELLASELGLEPGPELRDLERAVLSQDPALAAPVPLRSFRRLSSPPTPLTSFVGRDAELLALETAMSASRLVSLVGPAGVGKTRLALELARRRANDEEWAFIELASLTDGRAVPAAVAAAVGAPDDAPAASQTAPRTLDERVVDQLGDRPVVIVLDNCEHVLDAVGTIAQRLLTACPALTILVTSRESLGVDGERLAMVGGLSDEDATRLFSARAEAVDPRSPTIASTAPEVADLCRHLDGLPLAIELAAARTKTMPVPEIATRLRDRFRLLVSTRRSDTGRQLGLRAAIDWSYDLLFSEEQRTFRTFAVFSGGSTMAAAQDVCGPDSLDIVTRLVDKSLLVADTSAQAARYRMLESLRAYGLDRLEETGELDGALAAHRRWCIGLAEQAEAGIRGHDQITWLNRLDAEHENLVAALTSSIDADPAAGLRLIGALVLPWWYRGRGREARHWVDAYLARTIVVAPNVLAKALTWSGLVADFGGGVERPGEFERELDLAEDRQSRAIALSLESGDELAVAYGRAMRSLTRTRRALAGVPGDPTEIAGLIATSVAVFERHGDEFGASMVRTVEAIGFLGAGDPHRAAVAAERARNHALGCGNRYVLGRVEWIEGLIAQSNGDVETAYRHIERGLRLLDELGMRQEVTAQARILVDLSERRGEPSLAQQWRTFVAGRIGGLARHDVLVVASSWNREGLRARAAGDLDRARTAHFEALARYLEAGVSSAVAFTESCLGFLMAQMGDRPRSAAHHAAALAAAMLARAPASLALAIEGAAAGYDDARADHAAVLLGAASRLWGEPTQSEPSSHRADVAAITAHVQRVLGPASFSRAYERGIVMDLMDALVIARSESTSAGG